MPVFEVTKPDGTKYEVTAPSGTPEYSIIAAVNAQIAGENLAAARAEQAKLLERRPVEEEEDENSLFYDILRSPIAGAVDMLELSALGAIVPLNEETELSARDVIKSVADFVRPEIDNADNVLVKLGQGVGSILGMAPALLAGPAAPLVAASLTGAAGAGEASERAREFGASEDSRNTAALQGILPGMLDVLPMGRMAKLAGFDIGDIPIIGDMLNKLGPQKLEKAADHVERALITGGIEGAQEAAQNVSQNLIAQGYDPDAATFGGTLEEGLVGGGAGAITQGLIDLVIGRRGKGGRDSDGPDEPPGPQGELFPGEDLGSRPPPSAPPVPAQGELFPDDDLGQRPPPSGPPAQADLFDEPASDNMSAQQRLHDLERQRQDLMGTPLNQYKDVEYDPVFERLDAEILAARKRLQRTAEPQQEEMFPTLDRAEEERAQARAREREGLAAIERDDVEAFEQPDLFSELQEQERRRLGPEATRSPTQFMDELEGAELDGLGRTGDAQGGAARLLQGKNNRPPPRDPPPPSGSGQQLELEDAIAQQTELDNLETELAQGEALRAESDLETTLNAIDTRQQQTTAQRRAAALDTVLNDIGTASIVNTERRAEQALADAGIANTTLTAAEKQTIKWGIHRATDAVAAPLETIEPNVQYQVRDGKRVPRTEIPGEEPKTDTKKRAPAPKPEPELTQQPDEEVSDELSLFGETLDPADAVAPADGAGVQSTGRPGGTAASTGGAGTLDSRELASAAADVSRVVDGAGVQPDTLTQADTLTQEATDLLAAAGTGAPTSINNNMKRIASENGVEVTSDMQPADVVSALENKRTRPTPEPVSPAVEKQVMRDATAMGKVPPSNPDGIEKAKARLVKTLERAKLSVKDPLVYEGLQSRAWNHMQSVAAETDAAAAKANAATAKRKKAAPRKNTKRAKRAGKIKGALDNSPNKKTFTEEQIEEIATTPRVQKMLREGVTPLDLEDVDSPLTVGDIKKVEELYAEGDTKNPDLNAARTYLERPIIDRGHNGILDGLYEALFDVVFGSKRYRRGEGETDAQAELLRGRNAKTGQSTVSWAEANLSSGVKKWMRERVLTIDAQLQQQIALESDRRGAREALETQSAARDVSRTKALQDLEFELALADSQEAINLTEEQNRQKLDNLRLIEQVAKSYKKLLVADAVVGLDTPIHPAAEKLLMDGDLAGALRALAATSPVKRIAQIAAKLAKFAGDTKVEVVENLKDAGGNPVAGMFDPKTNTIQIDSARGMNAHTLLHEMTHAATSATLANEKNDTTKKLQKLFDAVKDSLGSYYGAQSLEEFVAEAMGNPKFQQELAQIYPNGNPVLALQTFLNTMANFIRKKIGLPPKSLKSALNETDVLIDAILASSPESRDAGVLFLINNIGGARDYINNAVNKASPKYTKEGGKRVLNFLTRGEITMRAADAFLALLPLHAVADMATKYIPMAAELNVLVRKQSGKINAMNEKIDLAVRDIARWAAANPDKVQMFNKVVGDSTRYQVDPTLTRAAAKKKYGKNKDKMKDWEAVTSEYRKLGDAGRAQYRTLRNTYKSMFEQIKQVLDTRLSDSGIDPTMRKRVTDQLYEKMFEGGLIDPYFPLYREGDKWLEYNAKDPDTGQMEYYVEAFASEDARYKAKKALAADPNVDEKSLQEWDQLAKVKGYKNAPSGSFVSEILKSIDNSGVKKENKDQLAEDVTKLFLDALPESSFMKGFRARHMENGVSGRLGFNKDAVYVLRRKGHSLARQLTQIEYGAKFDSVIKRMEEHVNTSSRTSPNGNKMHNLFLNDLRKRAQFAMAPNIATWSKVASSIGFNFTLGFNVSSALVNITALPMIVLPFLGGRYGEYAAFKAMIAADRIFWRSGSERTVDAFGPDGDVERAVGSRWSLDNYDFDSKDTPNAVKVLRVLSDLASEHGVLNRSITQDVLNMEGMDDGPAGRLAKFNMVSGWMFHHGERYQRQVSMVAAYNLELAKLLDVKPDKLGEMYSKGRISEENMVKAANTAIELTEAANGGVAAASAPRIAHNDIGRIAYMFKRYAVSMYYLMGSLAVKSIKGSKADKRMAQRQLAGIFGMTGLMAGVGGMPLFGTLAMVANMFLDDEEDDFETITRKALGEGVHGGLGNYLFGVDISARIGLSDMLFRDNMIEKDQSIIFTALEQLGGPVFGTAQNVVRGLDMMGQGDTVRGIEAMAPAAVRNIMKGYRFGTEGALTLRGDPILGDVGPGHAMAQVFGFAPAEYSRQLMENAALKKIDRNVNERRSSLMRRYYIAMRMGDAHGARDTMEEIHRFNKRHPAASIGAKTLLRSMKSHSKTSSRMHNGITLTRSMRGTLEESAQEFTSGDDIWLF